MKYDSFRSLFIYLFIFKKFFHFLKPIENLNCIYIKDTDFYLKEVRKYECKDKQKD